MDPSRPAEVPSPSPETLEFVRFCYRRRRVGWPELYDEMCAVAGRGLYRGWRFAELETHGIGFSLDQTLELARIAGQVAAEEGDRRGRGVAKYVASAEVDPSRGGPDATGVESPAGPIPLPAREDECTFDVRIVTVPEASTAAIVLVPPVPSAEPCADVAFGPTRSRVAVPMDAPGGQRPGPGTSGPGLASSLVRAAAVAG